MYQFCKAVFKSPIHREEMYDTYFWDLHGSTLTDLFKKFLLLGSWKKSHVLIFCFGILLLTVRFVVRMTSVWLLRSSLFWNVMQRRLVVCYRCFRTTYRFHFQGSCSSNCWPQIMYTSNLVVTMGHVIWF